MWRKLGLVIGVLVVLGAVLVVVLYLNSARLLESVKPQIAARLSEQIDGKVTIGDTAIALFPSPRLTVRDVTIEQKSLRVQAGHIDLAMEILPLLSKEVRISRLTITQPSIVFAAESGPSKPANETAPPRAVRTPGERQPAPQDKGSLSFGLRSVVIDDGRIRYASPEAAVSLEKLSLQTSLAAEGNTVTLRDLSGRAVVTEAVLARERGTAAGPDTPLLKDEDLSLDADRLVFESNSRVVDAENLQLKLLNLAVVLNGSAGQEKGGEIRVKGSSSDLRKAISVGSLFAPAVKEHLKEGQLDLDGVLRLTPGARLTPEFRGKVAVIGAAGAYREITFRDAKLRGPLELSDRAGVFTVEEGDLTVAGGGQQARVAVDGKVGWEPVSGQLRVRSGGFPLGIVQPLIAEHAPELQIRADLSPDVSIQLGPEGVNASGSVTVAGGTGSYKSIAFDALSAAVSFKRSAQGETALTLEKSSVRLADLNEPVQAAGSLSLPGPVGTIGIRSGFLDLGRLGAVAAQLAPAVRLESYQLKGGLSPELNITLATNDRPKVDGTVQLRDVALTVGELPLSQMAGVVTAKGATYSSENLSFRVRQEPVKLKVEASLPPGVVEIRSLGLEAFGGDGSLRGTLDQGRQSARGQANFKAIDITRLLAAFAPDLAPRITGTLRECVASFSGLLEPGLFQTLSGEGRVAVVDGRLKDLNLGAVVLDKLNAVPMLSGLLLREIPPEFRPYLSERDTTIKLLAGTFRAENGELRSRDLFLQSDFFKVNAGGTADFSSRVALRGAITFSPEFSEAMVARVKDLRALLDRDGLLNVPFSVEGTLPNVSVRPDVEQLLRSQVENRVRDKAKEFLDDLVGGKRDERGGRGPSLRDIFR